MRMSLLTWGEFNINDGVNYKATTPVGVGNGMASAIPNYIDMGQGDPVLGGKTLSGTMYTFQVQLLGDTDVLREAQRDSLVSQFLPNDREIKKLYAADADNEDKQWYLEGSAISQPILAENSLDLYNITIALNVPYWIEADENEVAWNIFSSTDTQEVENVGNVAALPIFELVANAGKSSIETFKLFVGVEASPFWGGSIPIDLTPEGLNTQSLITAGKMLSSGDDLRVVIDGVSRRRWLGGDGINTENTHVWTYVQVSICPTMTLATALDGSTTPATIVCSFSPTATSISIPTNKTIRIGSELISYGAVTIDTAQGLITFSNPVRNAKGSQIAAHLAGSAVALIPLDIWIIFGDPAILAPVPSEDTEPNIDLGLSTNEEWIYTTFYKASGAQGFTFAPIFAFPGIYYGTEHNGGLLTSTAGFDVPTEVVGVAAQRTMKPTISFRHTGSISHVEIAGEKYRTGQTFANVTLSISGGTGNPRIILHTEPSPDDAETWEPVNISVPCPTVSEIRLTVDGSVLGTTLPTPVALVELTDVSLTVAHPPVVFLPSEEQVSYEYDGYIHNNRNDHQIILRKLITKTEEVITIDCVDLEAYSEDGKRIRGMLDFAGTVRDDWMTLLPGVNELEFWDVDTTDVTITVRWRARNTI